MMARGDSRPMSEYVFSVHDTPDREAAAVVDQGLGDFNDAAAPLHEVQPLMCFVRDASGRVVGGAVGRTWGACCELQQMWVDAAQREHGLGTRLVQMFEQHAAERGCSTFYLDTFSFQARPFYEKLGYAVAATTAGFGHGIEKYFMVKTRPRA